MCFFFLVYAVVQISTCWKRQCIVNDTHRPTPIRIAGDRFLEQTCKWWETNLCENLRCWMTEDWHLSAPQRQMHNCLRCEVTGTDFTWWVRHSWRIQRCSTGRLLDAEHGKRVQSLNTMYGGMVIRQVCVVWSIELRFHFPIVEGLQTSNNKLDVLLSDWNLQDWKMTHWKMTE